MKKYLRKNSSNYLVALTLSILIVSCGDKSDNQVPSSENSVIAFEPDIFVNQDSINQANALAEAKRLELIKKAKERKIQDAKVFISVFNKELSKTVSPMTGRNPIYDITDAKIPYNELTETLSVVFESRWEAIPDFNPNSTYQVHVYKGKVTLYGNGEVRQ